MRKLVLCLIAASAWGVAPALAQTPLACKDERPIPIMATHKVPPYPPASVMTDEQGISLLEVTIGADGKVLSDSVAHSSGSLRLDDAALDFVKQTWLWQPSTTCRPVTTRVQISWKLYDSPDVDPNVVALHPAAADWPADALKNHLEGDSFVLMSIASDGKVLAAEQPGGSGSVSLDARAREMALKHKWAPAMMDGKPVPARILVVVEWKLPPAQ